MLPDFPERHRASIVIRTYNEGRRLLTAVGIEVGIPGKTELLHVIGRDPGQWTEALFAIGPAVSHSVGGILIGPGNARGVYFSGRSRSPDEFDSTRSKTKNESRNCPNDHVPIACPYHARPHGPRRYDTSQPLACAARARMRPRFTRTAR